jgi:50S ribosomal protein L16 3-hydroxylase
MLYHKKFVFINGESFAVNRMDKDALHKLADTRCLDIADLKPASNDVLEALHAWYRDGWIVFA